MDPVLPHALLRRLAEAIARHPLPPQNGPGPWPMQSFGGPCPPWINVMGIGDTVAAGVMVQVFWALLPPSGADWPATFAVAWQRSHPEGLLVLIGPRRWPLTLQDTTLGRPKWAKLLKQSGWEVLQSYTAGGFLENYFGIARVWVAKKHGPQAIIAKPKTESVRAGISLTR